MNAKQTAVWACEHARGSLLTHDKPSLSSPGMVMHDLRHRAGPIGDNGGAGPYTYESGNGTYFHTSDGRRVPCECLVERGRPIEHVLQQYGVNAKQTAVWACEHARGSLLTHDKPSLSSPGMVMHDLRHRAGPIGDNGGAGPYTYESGNDTYFHSSDGLRIPCEFLVERGRITEHVLQQYGVNAKQTAEWACKQPAAPS